MSLVGTKIAPTLHLQNTFPMLFEEYFHEWQVHKYQATAVKIVMFWTSLGV